VARVSPRSAAEQRAWREWLRGAGPPPAEASPEPELELPGASDAGRREPTTPDGRERVEAWLRGGGGDLPPAA
jgi:hypothetical protein